MTCTDTEKKKKTYVCLIARFVELINWWNHLEFVYFCYIHVQLVGELVFHNLLQGLVSYSKGEHIFTDLPRESIIFHRMIEDWS